jgi:hypothetical protein
MLATENNRLELENCGQEPIRLMTIAVHQARKPEKK